MTDNEKRAHDLAVAITIELTSRELSKVHPEVGKPVKTDYYERYVKSYKTLIKNLNRDYPDGL